VAYIGRDLEDAIRLDVIKRSDVPMDVAAILGNTNGTIVYNLVTDIIRHSYQKSFLAFSDEISNALKKLKDFNLDRIYLNPRIKQYSETIRTLFEFLFDKYMKDLESQRLSSKIFSGFLSDMSAEYVEIHHPAEIVRDFMAGMTDRYFLHQCPAEMRPSIAE